MKQNQLSYGSGKVLTDASGIEYNTNMELPRMLLDTNVLVAALRSKRGASHRLLLLVDSGRFDLYVSVPLILEYESVVKRQSKATQLSSKDVDAVIDYLCAVGVASKIFYLWRPVLKDPKDDMVLELAVAGGCQYIVTFNKVDFVGSERFGIQVVTPKEFLSIIGELP